MPLSRSQDVIISLQNEFHFHLRLAVEQDPATRHPVSTSLTEKLLAGVWAPAGCDVNFPHVQIVSEMLKLQILALFVSKTLMYSLM